MGIIEEDLMALKVDKSITLINQNIDRRYKNIIEI